MGDCSCSVFERSYQGLKEQDHTQGGPYLRNLCLRCISTCDCDTILPCYSEKTQIPKLEADDVNGDILSLHTPKDSQAEEGEWLYDVCERAEGDIPFSCKAGACSTCATEILKGRENLGEQSAREIRTLTSNNLDPNVYRLPCLCEVHGDITFGKPYHAKEKETRLHVHEVLVESYRPLNATVAEVRFFVEGPEFVFKPGQYMIFHIPHSKQVLRRSYSISTPPSDKWHFEICVRAVAGGHASNYVQRLRPGARLKVEETLWRFPSSRELEEKHPHDCHRDRHFFHQVDAHASS